MEEENATGKESMDTVAGGPGIRVIRVVKAWSLFMATYLRCWGGWNDAQYRLCIAGAAIVKN